MAPLFVFVCFPGLPDVVRVFAWMKLVLPDLEYSNDFGCYSFPTEEPGQIRKKLAEKMVPLSWHASCTVFSFFSGVFALGVPPVFLDSMKS